MTAFAIGATDPDINVQALADVMETKGKLLFYFSVIKLKKIFFWE